MLHDQARIAVDVVGEGRPRLLHRGETGHRLQGRDILDRLLGPGSTRLRATPRSRRRRSSRNKDDAASSTRSRWSRSARRSRRRNRSRSADRAPVRLLGPPLLVEERRELGVELAPRAPSCGRPPPRAPRGGRQRPGRPRGADVQRARRHVAEREPVVVDRHPPRAAEVAAGQARGEHAPGSDRHPRPRAARPRTPRGAP